MNTEIARAGISLLTEVFSSINTWSAPDMINLQLSERLPEVFRSDSYDIKPLHLNFDKGVSKIRIENYVGKRVGLIGHSYVRISIEIDVGCFVEPKVGFRDKVQWGHISIGEPFYKDGIQKYTEVPDKIEDFLLSLRNLFILEKTHNQTWNADGVINSLIDSLNKFRRKLENEVYAKGYSFYGKNRFGHYESFMSVRVWRENTSWNWKNLF